MDADDDEGSDGFEESRGEVAFLVVTWQLNRWPCHWLTDSLTEPLLIFDIKEQPLRPDNDNEKDKDKDKGKSAENLNICYIFEKLRIQGYQIW